MTLNLTLPLAVTLTLADPLTLTLSPTPFPAETGTYRWMAPEVICHERYSRSADVFSFGGVLYELICHEPPFSDRSHLQAAVAVGLENTRPALPQGTPPLLYQVGVRVRVRVRVRAHVSERFAYQNGSL